MTSLDMVRFTSLLISLDLNILWKIWDNVSTQVRKIYNTVLVVCGYLNKTILHVVPLKLTQKSKKS